MHIIFGKDNARALQSKYTVLELDTFNFQESNLVVPAYCIIENIGILELPRLEQMKKLHGELIENYGKRNWNFCLDAMEHLRGSFNGEVDSFYQELEKRIAQFQEQELDDSWSPVILK